MQRQKRDNRKRTGCAQCKKKHIQCSEELPRCRSCQRLDLECVRGLKLTFREDAIQRGISFGRKGVWTKRPGVADDSWMTKTVFQGVPLTAYHNRWVFLNLNNDDFQDTDRVSRTRALWNKDLPANSCIPNSIHHPLHSFPDTESYLLDYFIRGISPSCSLSELHNPYLTLVVPLCFGSNTLRHALLAVAANQLCLMGFGQFTTQLYHYKNIALLGLQQEISTGSYDDGTVASILMLCFHDISNACSPSWMMHLRAGLKLVDQNGRHDSSNIWEFFRMYFVAHDIMSRTACESWVGDEISQLWSEGEDLEEMDMLMGCSRGLMILINEISIHASRKARILKSRGLTSTEIQRHDNIAFKIGTSLLELKQKIPIYCVGREDLKRVAQIKHLAALLYYTERLGNIKPRGTYASACCSASLDATTRVAKAPALRRLAVQTQGSEASKHQEDALINGEDGPLCHRILEDGPNVDNQEQIGVFGGCRKHLASAMIDLISTLPDLDTLLWPLFVLGNSGLENEDQRRFVLDRLASIQKTQNLGNVGRAIDAVKHAFMMKSLFSSEDGAWGYEAYRYISLA